MRNLKKRNSVIFHKKQSNRRLRRVRHSSLVELARSRPATPEVLLQRNGRVISKMTSCCSVKAHDEGIVAMELIRDPPTLITASVDGRLKLWSIVEAESKEGNHVQLEFVGILHEGRPEREEDTAKWRFSSSAPIRAMNETIALARSLISVDKKRCSTPATPATPATPFGAKNEPDSLMPLDINAVGAQVQDADRSERYRPLGMNKSKSLSALNRPLANATPNLDAELQHGADSMQRVASLGDIDTTPSVFLRRVSI